MEYDLQLIGARLQAARKAKGYTQDYVSARADITEKFLSQIERGKDVEEMVRIFARNCRHEEKGRPRGGRRNMR